MRITFPCTQCDLTVWADVDPHEQETPPEVSCENCGRTITLATPHAESGPLQRCLVCPSKDLFLRKDFPQRLGVAIVAVGLGMSCIPWYFQWWYVTYAILFGTAMLDLVLYMTMGNMVECYRCHAQYRGLAEIEQHEKFDLETFEKYRQEEARLKQHSS